MIHYLKMVSECNDLAVITEVLVNPLSDTSVNVSWESVTVRGIVSYTVFYSPTEATSQQDEQTVTVPSSESSIVIEGLMTNVEYQFQVAAIAQLGEALFTGERSPPAETVVAQPTPPQTPTTSTATTSPNGNKILANWVLLLPLIGTIVLVSGVMVAVVLAIGATLLLVAFLVYRQRR